MQRGHFLSKCYRPPEFYRILFWLDVFSHHQSIVVSELRYYQTNQDASESYVEAYYLHETVATWGGRREAKPYYYESG